MENYKDVLSLHDKKNKKMQELSTVRLKKYFENKDTIMAIPKGEVLADELYVFSKFVVKETFDTPKELEDFVISLVFEKNLDIFVDVMNSIITIFDEKTSGDKDFKNFFNSSN